MDTSWIVIINAKKYLMDVQNISTEFALNVQIDSFYINKSVSLILKDV